MAINTRIITHEFVYLVPKTIEETVQFLNQYGSDAKIIAGGTDLLLQMKQEKISPGYLINIMQVPELSQIKEDGKLRIGAATKLGDVRKYCSKRKAYAALYEAVSRLGKVQVWNMGTIGGNLCNASPAADTAPPLLVLNGRVKLMGKDGKKTLSLEDFFKGVNITAMAPDEIMVEIHLDPIPDQMGSAFMKIARVGADISKISCAVAVECDGERCALCRIALGAVASVPMRAKETESILQGSKIDASLIHRAGQKLAEEVKPIDDLRSTAEYRRAVAAVLFKDVFWKAWSRASGEEK